MRIPINSRAKEQNASGSLLIGQCVVPLALVRNPRARRYVLRLRRDGVARVTIPRGGSLAAGKAFAERNTGWLERQLHRLGTQPFLPAPWHLGSEFLFRGEMVRLEAAADHQPGTIQFGGESMRVSDATLNGALQSLMHPSPGFRITAPEPEASAGTQRDRETGAGLWPPDVEAPQAPHEAPNPNLRPAVEKHLRCLAERELPPRVFELAVLHQLTVRKVTVRDQKSRWGSCSRRGTVSLNWRLLQTPAFVRDYIILHELMHLRQMNHSARFWREVERVCPDYRAAEAWLKRHSELLRA
ncbi:MAG: M48 family metallopeptidase [Verrucomicrobia bacterium]|nr:M48 family metallopeptidase [Verrucomicrobiota bacterium]